MRILVRFHVGLGQPIASPITAVFFCMRYKVTGFEAGGRSLLASPLGRRQEAGGEE